MKCHSQITQNREQPVGRHAALHSGQGQLLMPQCPAGVGVQNLDSCSGEGTLPCPALSINEMFAATLAELPPGYGWRHQTQKGAVATGEAYI